MNQIKHILLFYLLAIFCSVSYGQNMKLDFQTGIGTYDMSDLKDFNASVFKGLPFQAKKIADYPAYLYYKPALLLSFNKCEIGVQGTFLSTGSRISSKDYSGEYLFDTKLSGLGPGMVFNCALFSVKDKFRVWMSLDGGVLFSKYSMKENFTFGEEEINNTKYHFKSVNYYTEPGLKLEYKCRPAISFAMNAGYSFQLDKSTFESETDQKLNFGPDWSGLRLGLSVSIYHPMQTAEKAMGINNKTTPGVE